jgi:hypothetical protein
VRAAASAQEHGALDTMSGSSMAVLARLTTLAVRAWFQQLCTAVNALCRVSARVPSSGCGELGGSAAVSW